MKARKDGVYCDSTSYAQKEWFNDSCTRKKMLYEDVLHIYNLMKNDFTKTEFLKKKKDYKYCCRNAKRKFYRTKASELENWKKIKPRDFWKRFKRSSHDYKGDDIDLDSFFNHFKNSYSNIATNEDIECQDFIHTVLINQIIMNLSFRNWMNLLPFWK